MSTLPLRRKLVEIARRNVGKKETSKNQATWIEPLWTATNYADGFKNRDKYCAAGMAWAVREWLKLPEVLEAFGFTPDAAEKWRCRSASCFKAAGSWANWARSKGLKILGKNDEFHTGDIVIFDYSHIEMYVDDVAGPRRRFMSIGYNTNPAGSRDGDGCFEKPRDRDNILMVIRLLE